MPERDWDGHERRNGWAEYQALVLKELERLNITAINLENKLNAFMQDDMGEIKTEIAVLKVKAGAIGAMCGAIPATLMLIIDHFK